MPIISQIIHTYTDWSAHISTVENMLRVKIRNLNWTRLGALQGEKTVVIAK